jgi:hypothetical protein
MNVARLFLSIVPAIKDEVEITHQKSSKINYYKKITINSTLITHKLLLYNLYN